MKNETNIKVPKKYQPMIEEIYRECDGGEWSYWAVSAKGWEFGRMQCHTAHEDTQAIMLDVIRSLRPCDCKECKEHFAQSKT